MRDTARLRELQKRSLRKLKWTGLAVMVAAGVIVVQGIHSRSSQLKDVSAWTRAQDKPTVSVLHPIQGQPVQVLELPGYLQAYFDAPIHARVDGYLLNWYHDIGDHVKKGEVLANIDTPELDQELGKGKADLVTAQARLALAKVTSSRWQNLLKSDAVSVQDADVKLASYKAQQALVQAAQANVDRLQSLEVFKNIVAPFDGVVTARKTDVGALISAGGTAGVALFTVSDVHQLRLYVRVPQVYLTDIHPGLTAKLSVPEYPDRSFDASFVNSANAVNDTSGTVLVEMMVNNAGEVLKPGDYAMVRFQIRVDHPSIIIPASCLIFRSQGMQVALLGADHRVHLQSIHISQDQGNVVTVDSGLTINDQIVDKPMDSLAEGDEVDPKLEGGK
ncbi:MAG: efflux RND transporter periplasmic adaptor subunit [Pseudomonadales bacterium]|nr:efflux RND transporter periplasmic adaptor subunit [Pseudomonadales bacterium]